MMMLFWKFKGGALDALSDSCYILKKFMGQKIHAVLNSAQLHLFS